MLKDEFRKFTCRRYTVLTTIHYVYDDEKLIECTCSLKEDKKCNGYQSPDRKCPLIAPHSLKDMR